MVGRGSRTTKEINKENFLVLDLYGNAIEHGLWEQERDWQELFYRSNEKGDSKGEAPVKLCPECETVCPAQIKECPHCHYDFRKEEEEKKKKEKESELVLINEKMIHGWLDSIQEKIEQRGYNVYAGLHQIADKIIQKRKDKSDETLKDEMMIAYIS